MKTQTLNFVKLAFFAFLGFSLTLTSCSSEDGLDGVDGEMGPQGPDGQDGNANVTASNWFTIEWDNAIPTLSEMYVDIPEITDLVDNGGMVLMYLKTDFGNDNSIIHPLPFDADDDIVFKYLTVNAPSENKVGILVRLEDPGANGVYVEVQNNPDYTLRYVLVPATMAQAFNFNNGGIPKTFDQASTLFGLDN
ncbi:hypothetical protein OOZ15_00685 [Galbibacter sp. EGI 63066]|uniref:hypothetical protein n=1 Tax=Galbibacter sp. EGI 63066 TaxID=2993559 RepID=UPI00224905FC|nr:hypothetical protein [Galbibacter sp. EGI 63066]MCX2678444.1 hypothetical protein [Galbibacter sp. EGI 63066]